MTSSNEQEEAEVVVTPPAEEKQQQPSPATLDGAAAENQQQQQQQQEQEQLQQQGNFKEKNTELVAVVEVAATKEDKLGDNHDDKKTPQNLVSFSTLFHYASPWDLCLYACGSLGAVAAGAGLPLMVQRAGGREGG